MHFIMISELLICINESSNEYAEMKNTIAMAGNRTRVNCLGSSYAYHYTTNAI